MKALIFDLDGVVADTTGAHARSWARLAEEEGFTFDDRVAAQLLGRTREDSLAIVMAGRTVGAAQAEALLARKQAYALEELNRMTSDDALPGVVALLREARAAGLATALASSSRNARLVLDRLGIAALFDAIADGTSVVRPKPAPDIFLHVADRLGIAPDEGLVFEDSLAGIEAALAGGFRVVAVNCPAARVSTHTDSLSDMTLDDLLSPMER